MNKIVISTISAIGGYIIGNIICRYFIENKNDKIRIGELTEFEELAGLTEFEEEIEGIQELKEEMEELKEEMEELKEEIMKSTLLVEKLKYDNDKKDKLLLINILQDTFDILKNNKLLKSDSSDSFEDLDNKLIRV